KAFVIDSDGTGSVQQLVRIISPPRFVAGITDQRLDLLRVQAKSRPGGAHHIFLHHYRTEVVGAIFERHLPDLRALRTPRTLDVVDVVQKNPRERLRAKIFRHTCRLLYLQDRVLRLKRPADERGESAAPVLLIPNSLQVLDPFLYRFYMSKHHRTDRLQYEFVCDLHDLQSLSDVDFYRRFHFSTV